MTVTALPDHIEQVVLSGGEARVLADRGFAQEGACLRVGSRDYAFTPLLDLSRVDRRHRFRSPFPLEPGAPVAAVRPRNDLPLEATINGLPDWALENGETLQISLPEPNRACEIALAGRLEIPPSDERLRFSAALACHRAAAALRVHIRSGATGKVTTYALPFSAEKTGGTTLEGYETVAVDLPAADHPREMTLSLAYEGFSGDAAEGNPFLFLAEPEIVPLRASERATTEIRLEGSPVRKAAWFSAAYPVTLVGAEENISLVSREEVVPLYTGEACEIRLGDDYGHTMMLRASVPGHYAFFLNGKAGFVAYIGEGDTAVRLPGTYLTGKTYHLSVRDQTGCQSFFETYIMPPRQLTPLDVLQRESRAPFDGPLYAQAAYRYAGLKAHLGGAASAEEQRQLQWAMEVLEGGHERVKLKPLAFPQVEAPDVSIVIPCHNKVEVTYYGLCGLLLAKNKASFEVILVDDASTDETAEIEEFVSGITVVRNAEAQRFIRACNAGVEKARGRYVVLLNNDTEATAGWLDALIDGFERFDGVGLVGARLLYPDGSLQDAGGIIWGTGNPWNYGNRANASDPRFTYARQADYLSGAALMTTKMIWEEVGGLSSYLEPMYFEDTDFSFKIREAGYKTYYIPSSVVFHYEGMTSGTDTSKGFKRYQEVNRPKFKRRWAKAYAGFGAEGVDPDLEKDRGICGRVLFIDYSTPRPDQDAGSYAAIQEIKLVQSLGYKVTFLPENLAYLGGYTQELERMGVEIVYAPFVLSVNEFLEQRGSEFDAVYITRYHVAANTVEAIRRVNPQARIILNNADLHFLRQMRAAAAAGNADMMSDAEEVRGQELAAMRSVDLVLSYNDVEHSVIQSHTQGAVSVMRCPWVVETPEKVPPFAERKGISFLGSFRHHPNAEGVEWFVREVMPTLEASHPDVVLSIYGAGMTEEIKALASATVTPVGFVEDPADAYDRHRIFVAPLLSGAGIKGKVLSALAHGVPCVLSPTAAEGIGLRHKHDCLIVDTPSEWAEAIQALYDEKKMWQSISDNARAYVGERFSFATGQKEMRAAFEAVDLFHFLE